MKRFFGAVAAGGSAISSVAARASAIGATVSRTLIGALLMAVCVMAMCAMVAPCALAAPYSAGWYAVGETLPAGEYYFTAYEVPGEQLDAQASVYVYQAYADEFEGQGVEPGQGGETGAAGATDATGATDGSGATGGASATSATDSTSEMALVLELFDSTLYVTLSEGQKLEVVGADFVPAAERNPPEAEDGTWPQGMYRVGVDIAPGEYMVTADADFGANILVYRDSTLLSGSMVMDTFCELGAQARVSVEEGQYLRVVGGTFTSAQ